MAGEKKSENFRPIKDLFTAKIGEGSILELTNSEGTKRDLAYLGRKGKNNADISFHNPFYRLQPCGEISGVSLIATIWPNGDVLGPNSETLHKFYDQYRVVEFAPIR
jgi:hypothetical protein